MALLDSNKFHWIGLDPITLNGMDLRSPIHLMKNDLLIGTINSSNLLFSLISCIWIILRVERVLEE